MRVITVRRHAEGTLERAGEMVRAQPRQFGEGGERDVVGDMLLDIGGHPLLLPGRKAATTDRLAERSATVDANELVRQRDAERFGVLPVHRARVLDLRLELESGLPECAIVKEQARLELDLAEPQCRIGERSARINIEIGRMRQRARPLRTLKIMPRGNEGQLVGEIAQGRPRQAFNKSLTVVALRELCRDEQMAGSAESIFEWLVPHDLDGLHNQARPCRGMASDDLGGRVVDNRASFSFWMPCGPVMFGYRTCGSGQQRSGLIQGRFAGAGHCSIHSPLMMPASALDVSRQWRSAHFRVHLAAIVVTIKTRSLSPSRRVDARPSRLFERRVF